jgi:alkyldihydroxyacetonephosphate synthase
VKLPRSRLKPPAELKEIFSAGHHTRAEHSMGKAYRDVVRGFRGRFEHVPDLVAFPESPEDVDAVLNWCADERAAVIPFGGGTSVVGGVEPRLPTEYPAVVTLDMRAMDRLLEVDAVSRAARIEAGATGPRLEEQLREHGLTLRHFPQSFEYSTLGGWLATRAGGHYATVYTHVDDLVESIRAVTPAGGHEWKSRRLPASGAGPSPDRALLGSEGILGVITEAWMRVQDRPEFKQSVGVAFDEFAAGADAVREISQAALFPTNCRLLDATEAETTGAGPPGKALLVLGFESAHHPVEKWMSIALMACRDHGGEPGEVRGASGAEKQDSDGDSVSAWRSAFLNAPYLRDAMVACGVLSDTFETAITWDLFPDFHDDVMEAARKAVAEVTGAPAAGPGSPRISCRFTHVYPDGPAPYYTVLAPAKRGGEVEQWDEIKAAVSEVVIDGGGTITHHHAVGRDHRRWYDRQRPDAFAAALRAAKRELDPRGILNPGVLVDPDRDS